MQQITDTLLMVRPASFNSNPETAVNNYFQQEIAGLSDQALNDKAVAEFDSFVASLRDKGIRVIVVDDVKSDNTPDAVFPNNWVSFHQDGQVVLYPMFAQSRRRERREEVIEAVEAAGFKIDSITDYTAAEDEGVFLEGTGSLLLDRVNSIAYCALSDRAHEELLIEFCEDFEFTPVIFTANQTVDGQRLPIYHTNVMMALAENFAVVCLASIDDSKQRKNLVSHIKESGKEIVDITEAQMHAFAGNMLQVRNEAGQKYMVMSKAAHDSLTQKQIAQIEAHCEILSSSLTVIETCGGGSARCMMAEVFLPRA
ncbi:citrulline utilization hydrolase CtlX [Gilvibacter sp.]|uniref:citrulline utilization hydrolase CtlX n=1 Tax=Gilvibacter sp. TaxID=2729997 RepID=UPI0025C44832|nr:arginine deiminase-related protein [Gilvibacter sp.]NQX77723.1 amidinotransferase [Gilvibacter sp.]